MQVLLHNIKDVYTKIIINIIVVINFILLALFQMACSNIRYGAGVTREIGMVMEYFTWKLDYYLLTLLLFMFFYVLHLQTLNWLSRLIAHHIAYCSESPCTVDFSLALKLLVMKFDVWCFGWYNQDLQNMGARNVCLMTDRTLSQLPPVGAVLDSLTKHGVKYKIYEDVRVEPTDKRWNYGTQYVRIVDSFSWYHVSVWECERSVWKQQLFLFTALKQQLILPKKDILMCMLLWAGALWLTPVKQPISMHLIQRQNF